MFQQRRDPPVPAITTPTLPLALTPAPATRHKNPPPKRGPGASEHEQQTQWIGPAGLPCPLLLHLPPRLPWLLVSSSTPSPRVCISLWRLGGASLRGLPAPCTVAGSPPTRTFFQLSGSVTGSLAFFPSARGKSPSTEPRAIPISAAVSEASKGPAQPCSQPPGPPSQRPCKAYPSPT